MNSDIKRYLKEVKMIIPLHSKEKKEEKKHMGRIGIIGAMEEEIALLKEKMEIDVIVKKRSKVELSTLIKT